MTLDWRRPEQYPDPSDASLHRWAWEFLRRNPVFEAEAKAAAKQQRAMKAAGSLPASWSAQPLGAVLKRWGVLHPIMPEWRPRAGDAPARFDVAPRSLTHAKVNNVWIMAAAMREDRLVLEFDLDAPIDPQLDRARRTLAANQRKKFPTLPRKRNQIEKFPLYLRILDAQAAKAKHAAMLAVFGRESNCSISERTLNYWIRAATALRDGGYRDLLKQ